MKSLEDRFSEKISPEPNSGCWLWTAVCNPKGYGQIRVGKREERAHRLSWIIHRGPIPEQKFVLHTCDVRCCVNPDHLFLGDNRDNMVDMYRKGRKRIPKGSDCAVAKLTVSDALDIFLSPFSGPDIARRYGVCTSTVYGIKNKKYWKHLHLEKQG